MAPASTASRALKLPEWLWPNITFGAPATVCRPRARASRATSSEMGNSEMDASRPSMNASFSALSSSCDAMERPRSRAMDASAAIWAYVILLLSCCMRTMSRTSSSVTKGLTFWSMAGASEA